MANVLKMTMVEAIHSLRSAGLSCREIARRLGIHRETVSRHLRLRPEPILKPASAPIFPAGTSEPVAGFEAPTGSVVAGFGAPTGLPPSQARHGTRARSNAASLMSRRTPSRAGCSPASPSRTAAPCGCSTIGCSRLRSMPSTIRAAIAPTPHTSTPRRSTASNEASPTGSARCGRSAHRHTPGPRSSHSRAEATD